MRLATWNVNGLRARLDFVTRWLAERQPDVVALQELKLPDDQFPHDTFQTLGYSAVCCGQKSWNGVAVLSREPARVAAMGLPGQEELGARLLTAEVAGLAFASVYVPNGKTLEHEDYARKLAFLDALIEYARGAARGGANLVLAGDFNVCPTPLDTWNEEKCRGEIFHTAAERSRMEALLEAGLVDLYRSHRPDAQDFSWWDYRAGSFHKNHGLRIDLLLGARPLAPRVRAASIDREYRKKQDGLTPSDHAPVIVELE
jgi:exodeoxyribonuclease III